jgi:hypothetical protein
MLAELHDGTFWVVSNNKRDDPVFGHGPFPHSAAALAFLTLTA